MINTHRNCKHCKKWYDSTLWLLYGQGYEYFCSTKCYKSYKFMWWWGFV